jgi:hypothetical protein
MKFATAAMRSLLPVADLDPKVVVFKLPDHTPCRRCGQCDAVMSGDPSKPASISY